MSYTHPFLSHAIDAHFNGQPPEGIGTINGDLTSWPSPTWPSDGELAQWVAEYQAKPDVTKNPRMAMEAQVDACRSIEELKAIVKRLIR